MASRVLNALVPIADGTDVTEFAIIYDTLGRCRATSTCSAYVRHPSYEALNPEYHPTAEGRIHIMPDSWFDLADCGPDYYDLLVIPGGTYAAEMMSEHPSVQELVRMFMESNKLVGMIGAGSLVAKTANLARQPLTSPECQRRARERQLALVSSWPCRSLTLHAPDFDYSEESVVISKNLITSRGPSTAFQFALTLVEKLCGTEKRDEIRGVMMLPAQNPL